MFSLLVLSDQWIQTQWYWIHRAKQSKYFNSSSFLLILALRLDSNWLFPKTMLILVNLFFQHSIIITSFTRNTAFLTNQHPLRPENKANIDVPKTAVHKMATGGCFQKRLDVQLYSRNKYVCRLLQKAFFESLANFFIHENWTSVNFYLNHPF